MRVRRVRREPHCQSSEPIEIHARIRAAYARDERAEFFALAGIVSRDAGGDRHEEREHDGENESAAKHVYGVFRV